MGRRKVTRVKGQRPDGAQSSTILYGGANAAARQLRRPPVDWCSDAKTDRFFAHLSATSNVRASAEAAGMGESTVHKLRRRDPEFDRRWQQAKSDAMADLEMRAFAEGRFGRTSTVIQSTDAKGVSTRETRHEDAALTYVRLARHGLSAAASDDADRVAEAEAIHRARVEAAMRLMADSMRAILRGDHDKGD